MLFGEKDHTWLICAYKESPYLEECIQSLLRQTVKSTIRIVTSTPCEYIFALAKKYGFEISINEGKKGISGDWNFALKIGETELLTIAHQDDVYEPGYTEELLRKMNKAKDPILYFTNYGEIRNGGKNENNRLLRIKRELMIPIRFFPKCRFARRFALSFGNPICCPSITYRKSIMKDFTFEDRFRSDLDWEMEEKLSQKKGCFIYNPVRLMYHRIHEKSATTETIVEHQRIAEDYEMMKKFWPDYIARRISKLYALSEKNNQMDAP